MLTIETIETKFCNLSSGWPIGMYPTVRPRALGCRGVTGAIFAITAAILLGAAALATEAATWYLARQQSYSVADAAAIAGAVAYANGSDPVAAATGLASVNGFGAASSSSVSTIAGAASSTVTASLSGSNPNRVEVDIGVDFPTYLAALFHAADITVKAHAAASIQQKGQACLLSTSGDLTISMGMVGTYQAPKCYVASNATDATAVSISNSNAIYVAGITAMGGIFRADCASGACPSIDPLWGATDWTKGYEYDRPDAAYQVATTNPFSIVPISSYPAAADVTCPVLAGLNPPPGASNCPAAPTAVTITGTVSPTQPDMTAGASSICGTAPNGTCAFYNMDVTLSGNVTLQPGTYLFLNSSLAIADGAHVTCGMAGSQGVNACGGVVPGVTIVLAGIAGGQDPGKLSIAPSAAVQLTAASSAVFSPVLNGVLFYRDPTNLPADSAGSPSVVIEDDLTNSSSPSTLEGVMFFPGAHAWFAANVSAQPAGNEPNCDVIVAGTLTIGYWSGGNSGYYANFAGSCSDVGLTSLPIVQAPALVE